MTPLLINDVTQYVERNISTFHEQRLESVSNKIDFNKLLEQKNPYLFKAKNVLTAHDIVKGFLDAFLQSEEETLFGQFLEKLAFFVCDKVYGAKKADAGSGMDMIFEKDNIIYVVEIKAGWNWGNASQIKQLKANAQKVKIRYKEETGKDVIVVNGCCFGKKKNKAEKAGYFKICGQDFWKLISNDDELYIKIIEPIGNKAKQKNEKFELAYAVLINKFTVEFANQFCDDGIINWERLIEFNSGRKKMSLTSKQVDALMGV